MKTAKKSSPPITHSKTGNCTGLDNPDEPLRCVFSTVTTLKLGTGTTTKKQRSKLLWYIKQRDADAFGVRKINAKFVPVGKEKLIDRDTLLSEYIPEVMIHNERVAPALQELNKTLARADKHREEGQSLSAEMEYNKALEVDETSVRAIFGLGLVYMDRRDTEKSKAVFEELVVMEAAFHVKHKHLFNEFGIQLRKLELYEEAVQYYLRAVELTDEDENLYYNLARAQYEVGDWEDCFSNTHQALQLNPRHEHAANLCKLIQALSADASLREKYGKPPIPEAVAEQSAALVATLEERGVLPTKKSAQQATPKIIKF